MNEYSNAVSETGFHGEGRKPHLLYQKLEEPVAYLIELMNAARRLANADDACITDQTPHAAQVVS